MSVFASKATLTEVWRWQGGITLPDQPAPNRGVVIPDGNLIVAGAVHLQSDRTSSDADAVNHAARLAIFKLNGETGEPLWVFEDDSRGGVDSQALSVDVDTEGDVIVGRERLLAEWDEEEFHPGDTHAVFKLDGDTGEEIWRQPRGARPGPTNATAEETLAYADVTALAVTTDASGDAFFVGFAEEEGLEGQGAQNYTDYFVGKLDGSTGEELWVVTGEHAYSSDELLACDVDSGDNLIAAGLTTGSVSGNPMGGRDLLVVKFDGDDGEVVWSWQDGTEADEVLLGVTVDLDDNVYVAGGGEGIATFDTPIANTSIVRKLNGSTGTEIWRYSGEATLGSLFRAVSIDEASGVVVAAGVAEGVWREDSSSPPGGYDFAAVALNATTGEEIGRWQAGTSLPDVVGFVGFDSAGALLLGGYSEGEWSPEGGVGTEEDTPSIAVVKFTPRGYVFPGDNSAPDTPDRPGDADDNNELKIAGAVAGAAVVMAVLAFALKKKTINDNLKSTVEDFTSVYEFKRGSYDLEAPTDSKTSSVKVIPGPLQRNSSRGLSKWSSRSLRAIGEKALAGSSDVPPPLVVAAEVESTRRPTLQRYFFNQESSSTLGADGKPAPPQYRSRRTLMFARFVVGGPPPSPIEVAPKRGGDDGLPADAKDMEDGLSGKDFPTCTSPFPVAPVGASTSGIRPSKMFDTSSRSTADEDNTTAVADIFRAGSLALDDVSFSFKSTESDAVLAQFESGSTASSADYYVRPPSILSSADLSDAGGDSASYAAVVEDRLAKLAAVSGPVNQPRGGTERWRGVPPPFSHTDSASASVFHQGRSSNKVTGPPAVPPLDHTDSASASVFHQGRSTKQVVKSPVPPLGHADSASASVFHQGISTKKVAKSLVPRSGHYDSASASVFHQGRPTNTVADALVPPPSSNHWDSASCSGFGAGEAAREPYRSGASPRSAQWDSASAPVFRAKVRPTTVAAVKKVVKAEAGEPVGRKMRRRPPRFGPCPQNFDPEDSASGSMFGSRSGSRKWRSAVSPVDHFGSASGSAFLERTKSAKAERKAKSRAERMRRGRAENGKEEVSRGIFHVDSAAGSVFEGGNS